MPEKRYLAWWMFFLFKKLVEIKETRKKPETINPDDSPLKQCYNTCRERIKRKESV